MNHKLTSTQFKWLMWLYNHGGKAELKGHYLYAENGDHTNGVASLPFLHLVARGLVEG